MKNEENELTAGAKTLAVGRGHDTTLHSAFFLLHSIALPKASVVAQVKDKEECRMKNEENELTAGAETLSAGHGRDTILHSAFSLLHSIV
jgi:hypothetical protein